MAALGTRLLTITVDGDDYTAEVSKAVIVSKPLAESDPRWVMCGPRRGYDLEFTAVQDMAPGSLWRVVWSRADELVPCVLKPYGNAVPTETLPHYDFTVTVHEPEGALLGGEANRSINARQVIECVWPLEAKPVEVVG